MKKILMAMLIILVGVLATTTTSAWSSLATGDGGMVVDLLYPSAYPQTYPAQIQPGDQGVWLDVQMTNYYTMNYYDITTELVVNGPFESVVTTAEIENVKPKEIAHAFYQLDVTANAKPGEYKMLHKITYYYDDYNNDGEKTVVKVERTKSVSVNIYYSERIEIAEVKLPVKILPGEVFDAEVILENTGSVTVNDVDVNYSISTDAATVNVMTIGSSMKRIPTIYPGEVASVIFPMKILDTATVKGYKMDVTATYTSGATTTTETDQVAIQVIGKPVMRLAGVQADRDVIYTDVQFSLSVQLENIGTGDAKSVKAELRDTTLDGVLTSYVGTVNVDDTGSAIFDITDSMPGRKLGTALITYEDEYGNILNDVIDVEYFVTQKAADNSWIFMVVAVVLVGGFLFYRHQKRKKEMAMVD